MIRVLDSTLREGEQTPGVYFDVHIKSAIANYLDEIGIDIIEVGHPAVSEEIHTALKSISSQGLSAKIGAHARSTRSDVELAIESGADFLGIFYCVSEERLNDVFKKELDDAVKRICEMIELAKNEKPDILIRYTPEDTVRSKYENVLYAATAAVKAGADIISIADTTGFMVPGTENNMYDYVTKLKSDLSKNGCEPMIAVHCHNDRGLALANALEGIRAGAEIVDASVLGIGERAGIVDLAQILTNLTTHFGENRWQLNKLFELYKFVSQHSGVKIPRNFPIMGKHAFTHCAGVHTHAASVNPMHYESLNPELVGRERHFSLDHMSGIASIRYALKMLGYEQFDKEFENSILHEVKKIGQKGRVVDPTELPHIIDSLKHVKRIKRVSK